MSGIELIDVTRENWDDICALNPGTEGRRFVASNAYSIAQSVYEDGWVIKGIRADGELAGFTMYGYCAEDKIHEICRFMLDEKFQNKGNGQRALRLIIDTMAAQYACDTIYLSTGPDNARGKHVYTKLGFVPTGEQCGEGEDAEDIFRLTLAR